MARYRIKDAEDLRWNRTRRHLTRDLDTQIADWREAVLNDVLSAAWDVHVAQLEHGEVRELAADVKQFVADSLGHVTDDLLELIRKGKPAAALDGAGG